MLMRDFSGGINTRVAPSLLQPNQAQEYTNIDGSSGSLKSLGGPVSTGIPIDSWYTWYYANSEWVYKAVDTDFVEYRDILYSSNGTTLEQYDGTTTKSLGIVGPTNILDTTGIVAGTAVVEAIASTTQGLLIGTEYTYKVGVYSAVLGTTVYKNFTYAIPFILSARDIKITLSNLNITYFNSTSTVTIYRELNGEFYKLLEVAYGTGVVYTDSVLNISTLPILSNSSAEGIYSYVYTYYDNLTGIESTPSLPSSEVTAISTFLQGITASADVSVTHIRVYRIGGDLPYYTLVDTIANTTISYYVDKLLDITIAGNHVLDSISNNVPISGLKYITEAYAMLFAAKGDKLYYSDIAKPYAWPATNFIDFDSDIMGMGAISAGFIVFTRYKTFIITGNSPESFSKHLLSGSQGCVNHKTIQFVDNNLLWLSSDGICMSNGGSITVPSMSILGPLTIPVVYNSAVLDNVYYLSYYTALGNKILVFDFRYNTIVRYISTFGSYISSKKDNLYQVYNSTLQIMLIGDPMEFTYKSPILTEDAYTNYKTYKDFYISYDGVFTITIYIDKVLVNTIELDGTGVENIKGLGIAKGYGLEFKIVGTGTINEIEYKVLGRQNGK